MLSIVVYNTFGFSVTKLVRCRQMCVLCMRSFFPRYQTNEKKKKQKFYFTLLSIYTNVLIFIFGMNLIRFYGE